MKASALISDADRSRIAEAITRAEAKTSGEIVPVIATASGRYDRSEDIVGVLGGLATMSAVWILFQGVSPVDEGWGSGGQMDIGLGILLLSFLGGFIVGAALASRFGALRLPFVLKSEMEEEVERRAAECFHRFRLRETAGATGILVYVSLFEHRVRVLGDAAIESKLGPSDWQSLCDGVTDGIRNGRAADGLIQAIEHAGELLSQHFPRETDDKNELINELKLID